MTETRTNNPASEYLYRVLEGSVRSVRRTNGFSKLKLDIRRWSERAKAEGYAFVGRARANELTKTDLLFLGGAMFLADSAKSLLLRSDKITIVHKYRLPAR